MAVEVDAARGFRAGRPRVLAPAPVGIRTAIAQYAQGYDITADGQRFLATQPGSQVASPAIHVILNWQEELKQRVPTR